MLFRSLFFQLANIAEQHHRLRRRRQYEHEGRVPRESLAAAVTQLQEAGIGDDELRAATARLEIRPVLTAHPTEATRRTILQAHQRLATALRRLDDPELPHSTRRRVQEHLAEEVTVLWQTDEVRSRRPRVVDEVRNGLWFVEASLWQALPRLLRELADAIPGAPPPLPHQIGLIGAKDAADFFVKREAYNLEGVLGKITCPFLCVVGAEDWAPQAVSQGVRYMEELGSSIKRLRVVERAQGLGGVTHCNKDNLHVMHAHTFNFLNEVLNYRPATR